MQIYLLLFMLILFHNSSLAQENCLNDPSCQHTKSMLLEASSQWGKQYTGINHNKRSDSLDILHYTVTLDMTNHEAETISGHCALRFKSKREGVESLPLDFLTMLVDSVKMGKQRLSYRYNDTLLSIKFKQALTKEKEEEVVVYYHGTPQSDKAWGGFYYKGDYAYNLGVGFAADPHNYGRVWHPCFDNFKERATYTFHITTQETQRAHCNGYLQAENTIDGKTTRTWQQKEPIPTYLACIAVGDYTTVNETYIGAYEDVPIELAANESDTANLRRSFRHLKEAIEAYEYWYGPHRWAKVGYSLVPFRSGAMEHVSNIAYPISAANGTLRREHLMVHELGHSWWGNLVTCATAEDMWINEGMASYSEDLFWEYKYGWERYITDVKKNHYNVLKTAHQQEKGYRPISGVPHEYTYGMHVYNKGASVAHNMRWYMGDELFRKGLQYITKEYAFKNLTSAEFRDALTTSTGVDMSPFFDDWVFRGGYPHFEVAHFTAKNQSTTYEVAVVIRQKLVGRTAYCQKVPLQLTFVDNEWNKFQTKVLVSGELDNISVEVPFLPTSIIVNEEHKFNQARYDETLLLKKSTSKTPQFQLRELGIDGLLIKAQSDSTWLHFEHHPVAPSANQLSNEYTISKKHYWTIDGILGNEFNAEAAIAVHGKLDQDLTAVHRTDSLVLLYRPTVNQPWQIHPDFIKGTYLGKTTFAFTILKGDYALANGRVQPEYFKAQKKLDFTQFEVSKKNSTIHLHLATKKTQKVCVELYSLQGKRLYAKSVKLSKEIEKVHLPTKSAKKKAYFLKVRNNKGFILESKKVYL